MCNKHDKALALAERTVANMRKAYKLYERHPASETLKARMADQYAKDAELLDTWLYIRDLLRNGKAMQ